MSGKKSRKKHGDTHHIIPTSRGGKRDRFNEYPKEHWKKNRHVALHILFANMIPGEIIAIISRYIKDDGSLDEEFFNNVFFVKERTLADETTYVVITIRKASSKRIVNKRKAWETLFGCRSPAESMEWIIREFIKKEWLIASTNHGGARKG